MVPATSPFTVAMVTGSAAENLAGDVVVDPPGETGAADKERSGVECHSLSLPGEQNCAGKNCQRSEQQSPVNILAIDDPGNAHGRKTFEVQQQ